MGVPQTLLLLPEGEKDRSTQRSAAEVLVGQDEGDRWLPNALAQKAENRCWLPPSARLLSQHVRSIPVPLTQVRHQLSFASLCLTIPLPHGARGRVSRLAVVPTP